MSKKSSVLVKIDKEIYEKIKARIEKDAIEFPTIKNFVEKAVKKILETDQEIKNAIKSHHDNQVKNGKHIVVNGGPRIPSGVG